VGERSLEDKIKTPLDLALLSVTSRAKQCVKKPLLIMQEINQFPKALAELNLDRPNEPYIKGNRVSHKSSIPPFPQNVNYNSLILFSITSI